MTAMKYPPLFAALLLLFAIVLQTSARASNSGTDLTGQVSNKQGEPVPGALVMIDCAGPRQGSSPLCPSCYPDCGKKAVTDAEGHFRIESLDPSLNFGLRVLAPGYWPFLKTSVVPDAGPVELKIDPRDLSKIPAERHVQGRIMDSNGNPIEGATLDVEGVDRGDGSTWGCVDVDAMVITDSNGEFHITGPKPFTAIHAVIEAKGLAKRWVQLESGKTALVRINGGATVRGRLLYKGQPLTGIRLGVATVERACGTHLTGFQATTGTDGRFTFENIPPTIKFQVFSIMDSARKAGASLRKEFESGKNGEMTELGDLQAQPAHRISGKIVLADGKPLPPQTRLMLDRSQAWDFSLATLDADGYFEFEGTPEEQVAIYMRVNGYRFSEKNPNIDSNRHELIGRVTGDISNLTILLEPGKPAPYEELEHVSYEEEKKRNEMPLKGVQ